MYVKKPKPASQMPNSSSLGKKTDTVVYIKSTTASTSFSIKFSESYGLSKLTLCSLCNTAFLQLCITTKQHYAYTLHFYINQLTTACQFFEIKFYFKNMKFYSVSQCIPRRHKNKR